MKLEDGGYRIFLNTKAADRSGRKELADFLRYIDLGALETGACEYIYRLEEEIKRIRMSEKWRVNYMTWELQLMDARKEGREEGRIQGVETATLTSIRSLIKTMKLTETQAMEALQIPEEERGKYRELLAHPQAE